MIELYAADLHFLGDDPVSKREDLCLHGRVYFRVNDTVFSEIGDHTWCVTASALYFLRSLIIDHKAGEGEHMIPCCGHMMIPNEDGKTVCVIGCNNGIDFDVIHVGNEIHIGTDGGRQECVPLVEYKQAVIAYADSIMVFHAKSEERIFELPFDRAGWEAYKTEFGDLRKRVK